MKSRLKVSFLVVIGTLLVFCIPLIVGAEEEEPVEFKNRGLELAIREEISKAVGEIYPSDLAKVKNLDATFEEIEDLSVLKYCNNLKYINLHYNNITDLSPLSGLTSLELLDLRSNNVKNISPLSNLTNLQNLDLAYNNISNVSPLSKLYKLHILDLYSNNISDIQPLIKNFKPSSGGENNIGLGEGDKVEIRENKLDLSEDS